MAAKKNNYIGMDLSWAEQQLAAWRKYIDEHPIDKLKDRKDLKETKNGGTIYQVVATIESQGKYIQETMRNYLALLKEVETMREKEDTKKNAVRGDQNLSPMEEKII
jgi:hypothetical protein